MLVTKRPALPTEAEINRNPRSRSARMRVAERTDATALATVAGVHA